ncbi:MAG: IS4 family transposase [Planctomycetota bacterium]
MNTGRNVFSQLMDFLPMNEFRKCVRRYRGDYKVRKFSCLDQFLSMAFAQLTYRESLRDIEACLRATQPRLYHMGFRSIVSRSTLADANERRDYKIYADFAKHLIRDAKKLYSGEPLSVDLNSAVYVLDSSTIDLCMTLFPWAYNQQSKSAIKMHTLMNLRGNIPEFVHISGAKVHDMKILDIIVPEPGAFYVMDRGYIDFARLYAINTASAFFVIRAKRNLRFRRRYSHPVEKREGVRCDQTVALTYIGSKKAYPAPLRRISYFDEKTEKRFVFLTNNFRLKALTVGRLYKERWQIEVFFKWIKHNLRIKSFYGTSINAVKTQIWIAISVYVLVAIIRKELKLDKSLYTILQILSVTLFEKTPISRAFSGGADRIRQAPSDNQMTLFTL